MNDSRCTTHEAKRYVSELIGEAEARAPGKRGEALGRPYFHLFLSMTEAEARMEFHQIEQLPEGMRMDDLRYRMDVEGML